LSKIIKSVFMREAPVVITAQQVEKKQPAEHVEAIRFIESAREKAKVIVAEAQLQAENLIAEAAAQVEQLKQQASESGFQEGMQQGYQDGLLQGKQAALDEMQQAIQSAMDRAQNILDVATREAQESIVGAERQVVEIALAVARKILAREIEENPMVVLPIVRAALEKVRDQDQIIIRVNPDDYELVLQARRDLQMIVGREQVLSISSDQTIEHGSCMIESSNGTVDARLNTQFDILRKALQDVYHDSV